MKGLRQVSALSTQHSALFLFYTPANSTAVFAVHTPEQFYQQLVAAKPDAGSVDAKPVRHASAKPEAAKPAAAPGAAKPAPRTAAKPKPKSTDNKPAG